MNETDDSDFLDGTVYFLERDDRYVTEKPYTMRYPPHIDIPQSNVKRDAKHLRIKSMRTHGDDLSFKKCGFGTMPFKSRMAYEDFSDESKIASIFFHEVQDAFKAQLGASHVHIADFTVRRRHQQFPISTGEDYKHMQPTAMAHIDFTRGEAEGILRTLYGEEADGLIRSDWEIVNAWRPLRGPLADWPLALCDASTVDMEKDTMAGDIVYPTWHTENIQVMHSPHHKWYYLPDQMPSETLIFRSAASETMASTVCPHTGFFNPTVKPDEPPRESIECRAFLFFGRSDELPPLLQKVFNVHL